MKLTLLVLPNNPVFTAWINAKINGITKVTLNLIFKTWSFPVWNIFIIFCTVFWPVSTFVTISVLAMSLTSGHGVFKTRARGWLPMLRIHSCLRILPMLWIIRDVVLLFQAKWVCCLAHWSQRQFDLKFQWTQLFEIDVFSSF